MELAAALIGASPSETGTTRAVRAAEASGGNPLFIRELVTGRHTEASHSLPTTLSRIISERLSALPASVHRLLLACRILGPYASIPVVTRVLSPDHDVPLDDIEHLENEGILSLTGGGVLAVHECWQPAVDSQASSATRAALTYKCAVALESSYHGRHTAFSAMFLGELFMLSGLKAEARDHLRRAAEQFCSLGLVTLEARAYRKAIETVGARDDVALHMRLAFAEHHCGYFGACLETTDRALSMLRSGQNASADEVLKLLAVRADCAWRLGSGVPESVAALRKAIEESQSSDPAIQEACLWGLRCVLVHGRSGEERFFLDRATSAAARSGYTLFGALAQMLYAAERGSRAQILESTELAAGLSTRGLSPLERVMSMRLTATALRYARENVRAASLLAEAVTMATEHELVNEARGAAYSATFNALDIGDLESAAHWLALTHQWKGNHESTDSVTSRDHATSRLHAQRGEFRKALSVFSEDLDAVLQDQLPIRSGVLSACLLWSAAECGEREMADRLLSHSTAILKAQEPSMQMDFVAECCVRSLLALGHTSRANALAEDYVKRAALRIDAPFPGFHTELERRRRQLDSNERTRNRN